MPSGSPLPAAGQAAKADVSTDLVSVFFKTHSDSSLSGQRCSVLVLPGTEQCKKSDQGQDTFHSNAALEEAKAATYSHFSCGETEAQGSGVASPQLHSNSEAGPGKEASLPHLMGYKAMVGKGNQPGRSAVATGMLTTGF